MKIFVRIRIRIRIRKKMRIQNPGKSINTDTPSNHITMIEIERDISKKYERRKKPR